MGLLDPKFKYVPAASTDIRKTFERERKRLKREEPTNEQRVSPEQERAKIKAVK